MISHEKQDRHIGDIYAAFDVSCHASNGLHVILPAGTNVDEVADKLRVAILAAVTEIVGPDAEWSLNGLEVRGTGHVIVDREARKKAFWDNLHEVQAIFAKGAITRDDDIAANPDNGKVGFWSVEGVRHNTTVHSDSEANAIAKAIEKGDVGDWEGARASYIGTAI